MPFVSRMVVQSLLPGSPPDLSEEGRNLSNLVQHLVVGTGSLTPFDIESQLNEICPACGVQVPLKDITMAVCGNGHSWRASFNFILFLWLKLLLKTRNIYFSPMFGDLVYLINAVGPYMCWVQPKGFSATFGTQGTSDNRSGLGC